MKKVAFRASSDEAPKKYRSDSSFSRRGGDEGENSGGFKNKRPFDRFSRNTTRSGEGRSSFGGFKNRLNEKRFSTDGQESFLDRKKAFFEKKINETSSSTEPEDVRLNKRLSELGVASRRESEVLIQEGKIRINGKIVSEPSMKIVDSDEIFVNNKKIINKVPNPELYLLHKPAGYITSTVDDKGRKTVFELVPKELRRLMCVGRLDYNTEGLLLLTNNGELARYMELPTTGMQRTYTAKVFGYLDEKKLEKIRDGINIDGMHYEGFKVFVKRVGDPYSILEISIFEGKNREIRKVLDYFGLKVVTLTRISYGPYKLRKIPYGQIVKAPFVIDFHKK